MSHDKKLEYEMFAWMQPFHPVNAKDDTYLMFARMINMPATLLVTHDRTSKHMFCCERHLFIYPIHGGHCELCQAEPVIAGDGGDPEAVSQVVTPPNFNEKGRADEFTVLRTKDR